MAIAKVNGKRITKDGRKRYFYTTITLPNGLKKRSNSKKFLTRTEAQRAEHEFFIKNKNHEINLTNMTFTDLYNELVIYKKDKVKTTTMRTYTERRTKFFMLEKVKLRNFNINHYQRWELILAHLILKLNIKIIIISF